MGIEHKHTYRFGFLKSDKWKLLRLDTLARDGGICRICGSDVGSFGDAHHIFYPKSFWNTKHQHLVTLCRSCHEFVHTYPPKSKTIGQAYKTFGKLKNKWSHQRKVEEKHARQLEPTTKCWFCLRPSSGLSKFRSDHPKLEKFYPSVCPSCSVIMSESANGSENPCSVIRHLRRENLLTSIPDSVSLESAT